MGPTGIKCKIRSFIFFTIQEYGVLSLEVWGQEGKITLENLGLTKEDKFRFVLVTEMFETDMISFNSLNVPRNTFQI